MGSSKKVTIGYKYYMGLHMVICHGPVDAVGPIIAGERIASDTRLTSSGTMSINNPNLFGGEKKEGGIVGDVDFMFGESDQGQNAYLLSQPGVTTDNLPGFRGVLSLVAKKVYIAAMSPYPKPWWIAVSRYASRDWEPSFAKIDIDPGDTSIASANPAHIIRECLTDSDWGLGYSTNFISATFSAAAETLYNENFGLSMILTEETKVEDFIQDICQHINAAMYPDRVTGQFNLKLIRDDYIIDDLPVYDDENIVKLSSFQRPMQSDLVNEINLQFRRRGAIQDTVFTFQNLALVQIQGTTISQTVNYPGIDNDDIATRVGQRELQQQSSDLLQLEIIVNRSGWELDPGDPFVFRWEPLGIDQVVMRVSKIDYGTLQNGQISISAVQDVFGLPDTSYIDPQPPLWEDTVGEAVPITLQRAEEVPYFGIAAGGFFAEGAAELLDSGDAFVQIVCQEPYGSSGPGYQIWIDPTGANNVVNYDQVATSEYCPTATLTFDISFLDENNIVVAGLGFDHEDIVLGTYGFINDEVIRFDAIDIIAGTIDIGRGCLDTVPHEHTSGSIIWFAQDYSGIDVADIYQQSTSVSIRPLSQTGIDILPLEDAATSTLTIDVRQYKPYTVGNVEFDLTLQSYPQTVAGSDPTRIQWAGRDRLTQTVPSDIIDFFDGGIIPETNTLYDVEFYSELDLLQTSPTEEYLDISLGAATGIQDWPTELVDSGVSVFSPPDNRDLYMGLIGTTIGGTLSPVGVLQNVNNVTQTTQGALFSGTGHFDFGDFALNSSAWTIVLEFIPEDTGDDIQYLLGKHSATATDIFSINWNRTNHAIYLNMNSNSNIHLTATTNRVIPGRRNQFVMTRNGTLMSFSLNGAPFAGYSNLSFNWTGSQWTAGADYLTTSTRQNFYSGILREVCFYDGVVLTHPDIFPSNRVNSTYRVILKAHRDGVDALQEFDYTVPQRVGWDLQWDYNFNGGH